MCSFSPSGIGDLMGAVRRDGMSSTNSAVAVSFSRRCRSKRMNGAALAAFPWRPRFVDYLFVAFTQSSTFGPTDAPLLARWAKIVSMVQIAISLNIVILLISRAVGVL